MKKQTILLVTLTMALLLVGDESPSQLQASRTTTGKTLVERLLKSAHKHAGSLQQSPAEAPEWVLANPWPTDAALIRVRCNDNDGVMLAAPVLGLQSTLWHTSDGGENWSSTSLPLNALAIDLVREGNNLWVAGGVMISTSMVNGFVAFSSDRGTSWNFLLRVDSAYFGTICRVDENDFIAAGIKLVGPTADSVASIFYHTTNRGQTWTAKTNRTITELNVYGGVCFTSHNRGRLLKDNYPIRTQSIMATADGGGTWVEQYSDSSELDIIVLADSTHGWVTAYKYSYPTSTMSILSTTNGGVMWIRQAAPVTDRVDVLFALDRDHVWFSAQQSSPSQTTMVYETTNGGNTWSRKGDIGGRFYGIDMHFSNLSNGWIVGPMGAMFRTTDGGATWLPRSRSTTYANLSGVDFTDTQHGWVCGSNFSRGSEVLRTGNGGDSWATVLIDSTNTTFVDVDFIHDWLGCLVGNTFGAWPSLGKIYRTSNAGTTWTRIAYDSISFSDIVFVGNHEGWVSGVHSGLGRPVILHTTDAGVSWSLQITPPLLYPAELFLHVIDQRNVWAFGDYGVVLKTNDGGSTWRTSYGNLDSIAFWRYINLTGAYFDDANNGWLIGKYNFGRELVLRTTNGGSRWDTLTIGSSVEDAKIYFTDQQNGWILGETSYRTSNGGQSWAPISLPREVRSVCFIDSTHAWAVGYGGRMFKYGESVTGLTERGQRAPTTFVLEQNYPNPFNPATTISYQLPMSSKATLKVFDILGREVATLVDEVQEGGHKSVEFDASELASGVYLYQLHAGGFVNVKKMVVVK